MRGFFIGLTMTTPDRLLFSRSNIMSQPKKIRVLEAIRQGQIGGGESHLLDLVENLDKNIFEPVVLSFTDGPMVDRLKSQGIPTHIIHTERPFDYRVWPRVKQLMLDEKIDLVHAHGTRANSNVFQAAKKLGLPLIYTIHGWSFHDDQPFFLKKMRVFSEKFLTRKADVCICVSQSNDDSGKKYIHGFRSEVVTLGINQQKFNPDRSLNDIRAELNIPSEVTLVLFLARFTVQKQPLAMIQAFSKAFKQNDQLRLLMIGDGELKEEANALIEREKIGDKIYMQTFRQDVPDVQAAADIYVLPSLWEGLPLGLLEAMAMGKAIIASGVDGTREVIHPGKNGLLVSPDNLVDEVSKAILQLASDPALRQQLGSEARSTITNTFSAGTMTRKTEAIYQRLVPFS